MVSIGIPTYERVGTLTRALASAQAQTHAPLEIVVSDNGSGDGTEAFCRAASAADPRVRYVRRDRNMGPTANFNGLFAECAGDFVLMLADDDWLDPDYVTACLDVLRARRGTALVAGLPRYQRDGAAAGDGSLHRHHQSRPGARVLSYLCTVRDNGVFYGLMPRAVLQAAVPLPNVLGNDWVHVARLAVQGPIHMLDEVAVHRALGGTSADVHSIISTFGSSRWQGRVPQLVIAWELLADIGWRHHAYAALGRGPRLMLGIAGAAVSISWRDLAWHAITPSVAALARRPRGRGVWRAYGRITRSLGAGRDAGGTQLS